MSQFSLAAVLDFLDTQSEYAVMALIAQAYNENTGRGIFSEKFISWMDLQQLGYKGFRRMLLSLHETDEAFLSNNRHELYAIVRKLKGEA